MTLRKKLILSFILLVLILGSVIGYFSYQDAKELVLQSKEKEMADTINRIDISLNNWVDQVTTLAENIKENPMVTELMEEEAGNLTAEGEFIPYLDAWIDNMAQMVGVCSDILLVDADGQIRYCYSERMSGQEADQSGGQETGMPEVIDVEAVCRFGGGTAGVGKLARNRRSDLSAAGRSGCESCGFTRRGKF